MLFGYARSFSVFTATVISQRHVPPLDKFFDLDGDMYTIKVEEVFRGKLPRTVELFSENSSGRFLMTVGAKYILFIYREHGRLMVDNCGNSDLLTEGSATVAAVRKLSGSKSQTDPLPFTCVVGLVAT